MEVGKQVLDIAITTILKLYAPTQASEPQIPTSLEIPNNQMSQTLGYPFN